MKTTLKRKNIDLPEIVWQKLAFLAVSQGKNLKNFVESLLSAKADSVQIEIRENPSPSGDAWFDIPENMEAVRQGIDDEENGRSKEYSLDEIKGVLGV